MKIIFINNRIIKSCNSINIHIGQQTAAKELYEVSSPSLPISILAFIPQIANPELHSAQSDVTKKLIKCKFKCKNIVLIQSTYNKYSNA